MRPWATHPLTAEPSGLQVNPGVADFVAEFTGEIPAVAGAENPGQDYTDTRIPVAGNAEESDPGATRTLPALRYPAGPGAPRAWAPTGDAKEHPRGIDPEYEQTRRERARRRAERRRRDAFTGSGGLSAYELQHRTAASSPREPEPETAPKAPESSRASRPRSTAYNSLIMFAGTFVSRILGLVRSPILLAAVVGLTSQAGNAFNVANKLPNLIYMVIVGGIVNAVLVPQIVRATKRSDDGGQAYINKLLTIAIVGLGVVTALITAAAPLIVKMMAATMAEEWYRLTVQFAYWCLPQIFFYGMYTVMGQVLNARESFGPYMWAPALNNVVAILGFLGILLVWGPVSLADGADVPAWTSARVGAIGGISTLGIVAQALILVWPLRSAGVRFRFDFHWRGAGLGAAGRASWWMALTMLISFIPTAITSNVAAGASARADAAGINLHHVAGNFAYDTAYTIYSIPTSLFVVSIATAVFTRMSRAVAEGEITRMRKDVERTLKFVSVIMFLCAIGMIVLSVPISRIFALTSSPDEAVTLARVVATMSIGLIAIGAVQVLNRVYYAYEDTRGAFWINLPFQGAGVVGFLICGFLPPQWVVAGVGLVMSVTNIACALAMLARLSPRVGGWNYRGLALFHLKLGLVSGVTLAAGFALLRLFGPLFAPMSVLTALVASVVVGSLVAGLYLLLLVALKISEVRVFLSPLKRILSRLKSLR